MGYVTHKNRRAYGHMPAFYPWVLHVKWELLHETPQ
nr:MAG TPA: hypothetical protein [Caudoviricetes sp.]